MKTIKVVLDTNVVISAIIFGGKPRKILELCIKRELQNHTSNFLLSELTGILVKKFKFHKSTTKAIKSKLEKISRTVNPKKTLNILKDTPDNRVLETALEGNCKYIITGDKELLELGSYKKIEIVNPDQFLKKI